MGTGSTSGRTSLKAGTIEWGGTDSEFSTIDYASFPDITVYPLAAAAVVPIYNLNISDVLTLSRTTLPLIFSGNITRWNDPLIQAENPGEHHTNSITYYKYVTYSLL